MSNEVNTKEVVDEVILSAYDGHKRLEKAITTGNKKNIDLDLEMALDRKHQIIIKGCMLHVHQETLNRSRKMLTEAVKTIS